MQDGIAFCTDCGQPLTTSPMQPNFTQTTYGNYPIKVNDSSKAIKVLGIISASLFFFIALIFLIIAFDEEEASYFMGTVGFASGGLFEWAVTLYMANKIKKQGA